MITASHNPKEYNGIPRLVQARVWAEGTIAPCVLSMELDEAGLVIKGFDSPS